MLFHVPFTALCWGLFVLNSNVDAAALKRDVFDPPITYPTAGTVWQVGAIHNVTWNTSILPANFAGTGMIVLGFLNDTANDGNEHLDLNNPLATGFPLASGGVNITVPSVPPMDSYILVLFGDSGNASPQFTISNISIASPPSPSPSLSSPPPPPTSSSPSSITGGSSSTAEASSSPNSPSLTLVSASNSAVVGSSSPSSTIPAKTISVVMSESSSLLTIPTASSSSGSPSTTTSSSQSGVAENDNSARSTSMSLTLLIMNAAVAIFLSWTL